jgi:hypothetical protein
VSTLSAGQHTYRIGRVESLFSLAVLVAITAFAPLVLWHALKHGSWFEVLWLAILTWFWFNVLFRFAYRITVEGDEVEFKTLARRYRTSMTRIRSISSRSGMQRIRWEGGRVEIWRTFDGWLDFVTRVKAANPAVELKGV